MLTCRGPTPYPAETTAVFESQTQVCFLPYVVSSMSCQKSLHKYFDLLNIDFFWHWIYFYWSHFVAINISNSNFLIQGIIFQAECFSQYCLLKWEKQTWPKNLDLIIWNINSNKVRPIKINPTPKDANIW